MEYNFLYLVPLLQRIIEYSSIKNNFCSNQSRLGEFFMLASIYHNCGETYQLPQKVLSITELSAVGSCPKYQFAKHGLRSLRNCFTSNNKFT
jgi:hypothetical protein